MSKWKYFHSYVLKRINIYNSSSNRKDTDDYDHNGPYNNDCNYTVKNDVCGNEICNKESDINRRDNSNSDINNNADGCGGNDDDDDDDDNNNKEKFRKKKLK
jgi:hypothetical protein